MKYPLLTTCLLLAIVAGCGKKDAGRGRWSPAEIPIQTPWAADVSPANAHPEYPRPQFVREKWASLNGLWDYAVTSADAPQPKKWDGEILVPFCIESSLSGVGRRVSAEEALWYSTTFKVPSSWKKQRVMLNFDAVDWATDVYVNDRLAGHHTGGYSSFWQSVWMEPVRSAAVTSYLAVPDVDAGAVDVTVYADGVTETDRVEIWLREGGVGYNADNPGKTSTVAFASVAPGKPVRMTVTDPKLWSPESPFLYELSIRLKQGKKRDRREGDRAT